MKEGTDLLKQSITEENGKRKSNTLNFLDDPIPKSEKGEFIVLNIVQLARQNFQNSEKKKLKDLKKKIRLSNKILQSKLSSKSRNQKREISLTFRTIDENEKKYEIFANNILDKIHQEKKKNIIEVCKIRKEIPINDQHYFKNIITQNKECKNNTKNLLSNTYFNLQKFRMRKKNYLKKLILPPLNNKLNLNSERKEENNDFDGKYTKSIVNLYEQASHFSLSTKKNNISSRIKRNITNPNNMPIRIIKSYESFEK